MNAHADQAEHFVTQCRRERALHPLQPIESPYVRIADILMTRETAQAVAYDIAELEACV